MSATSGLIEIHDHLGYQNKVLTLHDFEVNNDKNTTKVLIILPPFLMASNPPSSLPSRTSTPNSTSNSRFTSQASTAEDLLKSQTVGLVHLSDFRKRRAEALEQKEREAQDRSFGRFKPSSRSNTAAPSDG